MNKSILGKVAGWGQLVVTILGTLATTGLPTNAAGWVAWVASLGAALGIHAASSTDGTK